MVQKTENYNLLEEDWIPVLWNNGDYGRVGIREALTEAGRIRQIAASNPMDRVALLRLLLALLQWCKPSLSDQERKEMENAGGMPDYWLKHKIGTVDKPSDGFNLLGTGPRFFQDQTQSCEKPNRVVSDLFAYFPAASEIYHFRHVLDQSIALCQGCCAVGLARLSACALQGGQGKSPSINNAPPIYFLTMGKSLLETLQLNWPLQGPTSDDPPAWEMMQPSEEIGVLEGFTWQPRSVWLGPLIEQADRSCSRCGAEEALVSELVFKKGRSRKGDRRKWRDPHVAWSTTRNQGDEGTSDEKDPAMRGPNPLNYPTQAAMLWRKTARAVLESVGTEAPILSLAQAEVGLEQCSYLRVTCFEPFTKQAKTFDEDRDVWSSPVGLLRNHDLLGRVRDEVSGLEGFELRKCVKAFSVREKETALVNSTVAIVAPDAENRLCQRFRGFVNQLAKASNEENVQQCVKCWRHDIHRIFREVLDRMCSFTTPGSSLSHSEATERAKLALEQEMMAVAEAAREALILRDSKNHKNSKKKRGR
jgi:hypothetical protein